MGPVGRCQRGRVGLALWVFGAAACSADRAAPTTSEGPGQGRGNPIHDDGWYADPEGVVFDGTYWIFPTTSAPYDEQVYFDAFSSADLTTWTRHERVLGAEEVSWAHRAMWAPSVVRKDGRYYFFFGANDLQRPGGPLYDPANPDNHAGGIGVAVSDHPAGPYRDHLGRALIADFYNDAQPIDQFVFEYQGRYVMYYGGWGRCNVAVLNEDFSGFEPFPGGELFKEVTPEGYVEGPMVFQRGALWYFMWSEGGWGDDTYHVVYGTSDSPFGPWERVGTILESDSTVATGAGHNSVMNTPGTDDWFIVYHRRPIPNLDRDHRVIAVDRLHFDQDGRILPVRMTWEGPGPHPVPPTALGVPGSAR